MMAKELVVCFFLVFMQSRLLDASPLEDNILNSNKIPDPCRHPLRFIMKGTERIPCPEPDPGWLPECAKCSSSRQCTQPKCWGGKCTDGSKASLERCFKPECAPCKLSTECSTKKCWRGLCIHNTEASKFKCFPELLKPECAPCTAGAQCRQRRCFFGKCTSGSEVSLRRCGFLSECSSCSRASQCITRKCWGGKCVYNSEASMKKCFPYHPDPCHLLRQAVTDPEDLVRIQRECK